MSGQIFRFITEIIERIWERNLIWVTLALNGLIIDLCTFQVLVLSTLSKRHDVGK